MKNKRYDLVISDLGKVLIHFDHRIAVKKILKHTDKKEEDIYNLFFDSPITGLYEDGKISSREFFVKVKKALGLTIEEECFFSIWEDIFFEVPLNLAFHALLKAIKPCYKLVMISNINERHFEFLKPRMPILEIFDRLILSYEIGCSKPDRRIYQAALDFTGTIPGKAFYIDDRKDLIEAASKLGIKGVVFDGENAMKQITEELCL